jgi:hypothetical protein
MLKLQLVSKEIKLADAPIHAQLTPQNGTG